MWENHKHDKSLWGNAEQSKAGKNWVNERAILGKFGKSPVLS